MSHKSKICNKALSTHVEQCFPSFTYTPLVVSLPFLEGVQISGKSGLSQAIDAELNEIAAEEVNKEASRLPDANKLLEAMAEATSELTRGAARIVPELPDQIMANMTATVEDTLDRARATIDGQVKAKIKAQAGALFDLDAPGDALEARTERAWQDLPAEEVATAAFPPINAIRNREIRQLGIFFYRIHMLPQRGPDLCALRSGIHLAARRKH